MARWKLLHTEIKSVTDVTPPKASILWRSGGAYVVKGPESNACGSVATGRVSHTGQVKGDGPD